MEDSVRTAIIAGQGALPVIVASALDRRGERPFVVVLEGEGEQRFGSFDFSVVRMGDFAELARLIEERDITDIVMAGGIERRPAIGDIRPTFRSLKILPGLVRSLFQGDDAALKNAIALFESHGLHVRGVHEIVPDLLAKTGVLTIARPDRGARADIKAAKKVAKELGRLDIGQGCIAAGGRVVAVEAAEGTDQMIERVGRLRKSGRIAGTKSGVLVKMAKPQQDDRVDLPTMGVTTIEKAAEAGLTGMALEAGRSLLIDIEEVIARADALGLFVLGTEPDAP